jgi:capsular polysaccharide biosynthesis protein
MDSGFEYIFTEEMTTREQIELFQQAKCIVAPNGSALLNLIFANIDTKVLILIQPNLHNYVTLQSPLELLGYEILAVCGDYAVSENQKHSDFSVPLPVIYEALSQLCIR